MTWSNEELSGRTWVRSKGGNIRVGFLLASKVTIAFGVSDGWSAEVGWKKRYPVVLGCSCLKFTFIIFSLIILTPCRQLMFYFGLDA